MSSFTLGPKHSFSPQRYAQCHHHCASTSVTVESSSSRHTLARETDNKKPKQTNKQKHRFTQLEFAIETYPARGMIHRIGPPNLLVCFDRSDRKDASSFRSTRLQSNVWMTRVINVRASKKLFVHPQRRIVNVNSVNRCERGTLLQKKACTSTCLLEVGRLVQWSAGEGFPRVRDKSLSELRRCLNSVRM